MSAIRALQQAKLPARRRIGTPEGADIEHERLTQQAVDGHIDPAIAQRLTTRHDREARRRRRGLDRVKAKAGAVADGQLVAAAIGADVAGPAAGQG
jgi:hypothetical protein